MNILNPEIIEQEEQRLLLSIADCLDLDAACAMFEKKLGIQPIEKTKIQSSDIVVFESQIAFKLLLEAPFSFSVLIDRLGNFLKMDAQNHEPDEKPVIRESTKPLADPEIIQKSEKEIIEKIASTLEKDQIKELFEQKFNFELDGNIQLRNGKMLIHQNSLTYKLNYDARLTFELLLDRSGNSLTPNHANGISNADDQKQPSDAFGTELYEGPGNIGLFHQD